MAGIDLLNLQPHQVSRDLRGYSVFFYGEPKSGKTTIATKFPHHLLLAFEQIYFSHKSYAISAVSMMIVSNFSLTAGSFNCLKIFLNSPHELTG